MSSAFSQWLTNRNYERIQTHDAPSEDTEKEKNSSRKSNPHGTWKWCYLFHSLLIEIKIHSVLRCDVPKIEMFGFWYDNAVSCFKSTRLNLTV